jgi:hypothetical protein
VLLFRDDLPVRWRNRLKNAVSMNFPRKARVSIGEGEEPNTLKTLLLLTLSSALSLTAWAAGATGTWTGDLIPQGSEERKGTAHLVLKQEGTQITGTAGPNADEQHPILKGRIEGGKLLFEVDREGGVISFVLTQEDDEIKGDITMQREGGTRTAKISVKRQKP